jgi:hypothetical protein
MVGATKRHPVVGIERSAAVFPLGDVVGKKADGLGCGATVSVLDRLASPSGALHHGLAPGSVLRGEKIGISPLGFQPRSPRIQNRQARRQKPQLARWHGCGSISDYRERQPL